MKKLLSFILAISMCLTCAVTVFATEEQITEYLGDVQNDGVVTAADARLILRAAVSLEKFDREVMILADLDFDGYIRAADARIALRTSVGLEESVKKTFVIKDYKAPDCESGGFIKAFLVDDEKELYIETVKLKHKFDQIDLCKGQGDCILCGKHNTFDEKHDFEGDSCKGISVCRHCGKTTEISVVHNFVGSACKDCGYLKSEDDYVRLLQYLRKRGSLEDGIYYVTGTNENGEFSLCYNTNTSELYVAYYYYVSVNGQQVDYYCFLDIPKDFKSYVSEVDCYVGDLFCAYGVYNVNVARLSNDKINNAVTLVEYDCIEGMESVKNEFATLAEGTALMSIDWFIDYVKSIGLHNLTAKDLGCPQLR